MRPTFMPQKPTRQHAIFPWTARNQHSQTHQHEANPKHPVHSEERGVCVKRCRVQALHVIECDWRIDHEPE